MKGTVHDVERFVKSSLNVLLLFLKCHLSGIITKKIILLFSLKIQDLPNGTNYELGLVSNALGTH